MKSLVSRSALIALVLLVGLIAFSATPSIADNLSSTLQSDKETDKPSIVGKSQPQLGNDTVSQQGLSPATSYVATAYSLRGRTASGRTVSRGIIAADPSILPLGSRVRLEHPGYSGEYLVADTGGAIRGRHIDIWTPSSGEAMRFGRRTVKLTVLSYGSHRKNRGQRVGKG